MSIEQFVASQSHFFQLITSNKQILLDSILFHCDVKQWKLQAKLCVQVIHLICFITTSIHLCI